LKKALEEQKRLGLKQELDADDRKRPYNSSYQNQNNSNTQSEITEEELEAYRLKKHSYEDPMAKYIDTDDQ